MKIDQLKENDIITFEGGDKAKVLSRFDNDGRKFVCVQEIVEGGNSESGNVKIMEIHVGEGTLENIINPELLKVLAPIAKDADKRIKENVIARYDGKSYTVKDYETILVSEMNAGKCDVLFLHSNKLKSLGYKYPPSVLTMALDYTYESWLEFLNKEGSNWAKERLCNQYAFKDDYDMVSWTIECFLRGKEERKEYITPILYYQIGYYKYKQINDDLPLNEMVQQYEGKILSAGQWYNKAINAGFDVNEITDGKWCIDYYNRWKTKTEHRSNNNSKDGCYIATAVYGSYNCHEVWTLRRFRDNYLSKSVWGRCFIKAYYYVSPKLVELFGKNKMFNKIFKIPLDKIVERLNKKGIENTYYEDH